MRSQATLGGTCGAMGEDVGVVALGVSCQQVEYVYKGGHPQGVSMPAGRKRAIEPPALGLPAPSASQTPDGFRGDQIQPTDPAEARRTGFPPSSQER